MILTVGASLVAAGAAQAAVVAAWDFQTTTTGGTAAVAAPSGATASGPNTTPKVYVSNFGSGTLYLDGSNGSSNFYLPANGATGVEINGFSGTSVNADTSIGMSTVTSSPAALAVVGGTGTGTATANGKAMVFKFSMSGYAGLSISYATQRTSTGFTSQVFEYSTNGTTWSSIGSNTNIQASFSAASSGVATTFAGIAGLDNAAVAYVRVTFSGATAGAGNNRLDNFVFAANAVPAPGAIALVGMAGLITSRRRK